MCYFVNMTTFNEKSVYSGEYDLVPVDTYLSSSEPVGMAELCYCAGFASYDGENIHAAHLSPGSIGEKPEDLIKEVNRQEKSVAILGVQVDPDIESIVKSLNPDNVYQSKNFVITPEGEIYKGREEKRNSNLL